MILTIFAFVIWVSAWRFNSVLAASPNRRIARVAVPVLFGVTILAVWECLVRGLEVPSVILPAPSAISDAFLRSLDILWADFVQTVIKGALSGYAIGCSAAFAIAILIDRSPFFQRGLLPVGNFLAALPIVGTAPIFVMWFGFGWQSKAAVVVAMIFFPMLVNLVQGLAATDPMQRDLMKTYGASYWQTMLKLKLPAAMPFAFNGLKICATLSLIGAIVAEFFGSPTLGMGFRISTEVGRLALDVVWAEIVVAAVTGSVFFGLIAMIEQGVTFWHPSRRSRQTA
ncbi:MAG: ABC transporter permease [Rhodobacteraceae bacterium]|nr:ABC transporter permease [Paracoccaceae bacterium]